MRELTQVLDDYSRRLKVPLSAAILPLVEQAIQQAQEKAEYFLRLAAEQHERDAAALAEEREKMTRLREWLEKMRDNQTANPPLYMAFSMVLARLRETPAPPEPTDG